MEIGPVQKPRPRNVVRGIMHPKEAWEALAAAGCIPASMVEDPARRFHATSESLSEDELSCYPMTVSQAVEIAEGLPEWLEAEALAREVVSRLVAVTAWFAERGAVQPEEDARDCPFSVPDMIVWRFASGWNSNYAPPIPTSADGWLLVRQVVNYQLRLLHEPFWRAIEELSESWEAGAEGGLRRATSLKKGSSWGSVWEAVNKNNFRSETFVNPFEPLIQLQQCTHHGFVRVEHVAVGKGVAKQAITIVQHAF